jgi:integrase
MPLYRRPGSPYWWVRIGRKTRRSTGTADKRAAKEFEEVLKERVWRREKLGDRSSVSWNEATERYLNDSTRARKREREFIAWLKPRIGIHPISAVADPDVLEQLRQDGLAAGWAHSTVDRMMRVIRAVMRKCAKKWKYLEAPPAVPMYGADDEEDEPHWLTREEFERLKSELPIHLKLAAEFAVLTLLRMRAQSQLTWERVDMVGQRAWVPRGQMKGGKTFGVALSSRAVKVLREVRRLGNKGDRVFQYDGRPVDNFNTAAFKKAVERAKLTPLRWHDLRHTGASWAVQNGCTLLELMALGDWKSYRSVLRYAHFAPSHAAGAAELVAQREHIRQRGAQRGRAKKAAKHGK